VNTKKSAATLLDLPQYVNIAMNKEREYQEERYEKELKDKFDYTY
jgi:hypothetical protein